VIKIDRSVVSGLHADPVLAKLVQSLVEFAHGCDIEVVAEGVETADEAAAPALRGGPRPGLALRPSRPSGSPRRRSRDGSPAAQ
jgi:predicted signal transduction protein with EAL and GGDEF domain